MSQEMQEQFNLTVGDRINLPFLLANDIMKISEALIRVEGEQSEQEVREAVLNFESSIPDALKDRKFYDERSRAVVTVIEDRRKTNCGVKVGRQVFDGVYKNQIEVSVIQPYKLKSACINLLQRAKMLSKVVMTEVATGEAYIEKDLEELEEKGIPDEIKQEDESDNESADESRDT